ncbi:MULTISPECIES: DMT family transporter [unclassified Bosea (in: a-proteobacteria)]|uniref:DMT family transporter n=1 Tax=unclassified Bosea (in: a-proteobacteria) TaxID=2653178 RepID=UPI0009555AE8|nr:MULTISPECIES: DMT family transporter [unclassified Bosea (in: a-proteobacteria)]SIQ61323.1 Permease of the drug/metabolite transporter (DMT) superfamily [Bosea sp. TND4EK4]
MRKAMADDMPSRQADNVHPDPMATPSLARRLWGNAYLLMILTTLIWGGNAVASRMAVGNITPMALTSLRWVAVCMLMPLLIRRDLVTYWPQIRERWRFIALLGIAGFTGFNTLMYLAAYSTSAINIGILQGSIPVIVLVGAFFAYRIPITGMQALGVVVTLLGVAVTASRGDIEVLTGFRFVPGDLLMILACVFYASYTVGVRNRPAVPALVFFTAAAGFACLFSLPLFAAEIALGAFHWPTATGWGVLAFTVIMPSIVSQLTFMRAIELIGPGRAGLFVNLVPVFAPLLAVLILGEPFGLYHAVALVLVLGGIFIAERLGR